ncbi:MAG: class I tRNA ligase family protein [Nitrososphaeraceae archaeon]
MGLSNKFDIKVIENETRQYLANIDIKSLIQNDLKKKDCGTLLGYIDGPPTLNGEPHAGHLRGRIIKDLWYRFKTLQKNNIIFRAGWDTQGLPIELQAEKELGLTGSKIENVRKVGIQKIVDMCKMLIERYGESWRTADDLLGMSFDYERAYWTFKDEYIEREWQYLKRAWEYGILKEWFRVVAYCPSCQTSLSNAEIKQAYATVEDPSLYYKVKLVDDEAYIIVWTTMPFTVVTDELVGVHPDAKYAFVTVKNEKWIIAENRLKDLMKELHIEEFSVDKVIMGAALDGQAYIHPFLDLIPELHRISKSIHFVVAESFVDVGTGSGIVHISPANGEQDFEIAVKRKIPIFAPIDDAVHFTDKAGFFSGMFVRDADLKVSEILEKGGSLIKLGKINHQYPTCWRSHHKVIWLARREYFYMIDELEKAPIDAAKNVEYFYDPPKNRFLEIIKEQVPWCITRERLWGTPLPIWVCMKCGHKEFLFSRNEISKKAISLPDGPDFGLHRPEIDRIEIACEKCRAIMQREPFVLDTWHNSGAAPYASLTDSEYQKTIPATFLTEGIDQTRGWAYTLLIENVILNHSAIAPYQSFLFQGHVLDENGNKMSKSLGNVIDAKRLLTDSAVDLVRYYFMWKSSPIEALSFSVSEMLTRPHQILSTLYFLHIYFEHNSSYDRFDKHIHSLKWVIKNDSLAVTEIWLLSKLQKLINVVTSSFEHCRFHDGAKAIEEFIINFISQTYVPMIRNDIWEDNVDSLNRRLVIYSVLGHSLHEIDILLHPIAPFITEYLYQNCFKEKESIIIENWPTYDQYLVNENIENSFNMVKDIISLANAARTKANLKRRWPINEVLVCCLETSFINAPGIGEVLKNQLNTEDYKIVNITDPTKTVDHISNLLNSNVPIVIKASLNTKNIASRLKDKRIISVRQAFEGVDRLEMLRSLHSSDCFPLKFEGGEIVLSSSDLELSYEASEGYKMAGSGGLFVLISTKRDERLIAKGILRDLARNLQQIRKEQGYNPTDILSAAYVAYIDNEEINSIKEMKEELIYLVRVRSVMVTRQPIEGVSYKEVELDGRKVLIAIA